jgi:hypothetical protein
MCHEAICSHETWNHMNDTTHIQTEVGEETYDTFRELAHERGLSIRTALQEATEAWIEREREVASDDALFALVEEAGDDSLPDTARTDASTESDLVDDWSGDANDIRLADPD